MKKINLKKKYYGILKYSYTNDKKKDVFNLKEFYQCCDCADTGIELFETKEEAKDNMIINEIPDILVEFTTKIIK